MILNKFGQFIRATKEVVSIDALNAEMNSERRATSTWRVISPKNELERARDKKDRETEHLLHLKLKILFIPSRLHISQSYSAHSVSTVHGINKLDISISQRHIALTLLLHLRARIEYKRSVLWLLMNPLIKARSLHPLLFAV